jgi:uncharacterized membrane protein YphA (DoxX/SURF4 family)
MLLSRLARPMLAAIFVHGGIDTLRNPAPRVSAAESLFSKLGLRNNTPMGRMNQERLVKANAVVMTGAGALLAIGKYPRLASLALIGSLVPTTLAGHGFWEHEDPKVRAGHKIQLLKNLSSIGGLLICLDTAGPTPSRPDGA